MCSDAFGHVASMWVDTVNNWAVLRTLCPISPTKRNKSNCDSPLLSLAEQQECDRQRKEKGKEWESEREMEVSRDSAAPVPATRFHTGLDQYIHLPLSLFRLWPSNTHSNCNKGPLWCGECSGSALPLWSHTHVCVSITSEDITEIVQTYPNHS